MKASHIINMKPIIANISIPEKCFLHELTKLHGMQVWKDDKGRLYTWDRMHGHVEKFTKNGKHICSCDPFDRKKVIEGAVAGSNIKI